MRLCVWLCQAFMMSSPAEFGVMLLLFVCLPPTATWSPLAMPLPQEDHTQMHTCTYAKKHTLFLCPSLSGSLSLTQYKLQAIFYKVPKQSWCPFMCHVYLFFLIKPIENGGIKYIFHYHKCISSSQLGLERLSFSHSRVATNYTLFTPISMLMWVVCSIDKPTRIGN